MKLTTITLLAAISATSASAAVNTEILGSLIADTMYHCADEHTDHSYMAFLSPVMKTLSAEQLTEVNIAGRAAFGALHAADTVNLKCEFVTDMIKNAIQ